MKIYVLENSPEKLHLSLKPATIATSVGGLVFLLCGTITLWLQAGRVEVTANENGLHYQDRWLGFYTRQAWSMPAEVIQSVELIRVNLGIYRSLEVEVQARDSKRRLAFPLADGPTKESIVGRLRNAVVSDGVPFRYESSGLIAGFIMGSLCILGGCVCFYSIHSVDLTALSSVGIFTIHRGTFWRRKLIELPIEQLQSLTINAWQVATRKHLVVSYNVLLKPPNGAAISLTPLPSFDRLNAEELIYTTRRWLTLARIKDTQRLRAGAKNSSVDSTQAEHGHSVAPSRLST